MQTSWKQGNLLPVHFKHLSRVHLLCEKNGRRDLVAIKFKDNAADIVKTVDRAGLMTNRFKDISLRTKDDLEDMFGQREGSYDYASDATMHGMADGTDIAMRAGAEMIHKAGFEKAIFTENDEYIHQNGADIDFSYPGNAQSDENIHHAMQKYGTDKLGKEREKKALTDLEIARNKEEAGNGKVSIRTMRGEGYSRIRPGSRDIADTEVAGSASQVQRRQKEYAVSRLRKNEGRLPAWIPWRGSSAGSKAKEGSRTARFLKKIIEDVKALSTSLTAAGAVLLMVVIITVMFSATFMTVGDEEGNNFAYDFYEIGPGDTAIVKVAQAQLGNVGGNKFWKWYGFNSHVHWCACFVSWCGDQCGYIKAGIIPKYAICGNGANWFKERHRWASRGYSPKPGDIIFFDFEHDGVMDHTGIVESCDGKTVTTIEGNSGNACKRQSYVRGSSQIAGYGVPAFNIAPETKKDDKKKETE